MDDRTLLGRYELHDRLGRGGMATVFRATDLRLDRDVAVKVFASGTAVEDARRRTEATMLARLSHPHLVALHDAHLAADGDSTPSFLVMELVDGEDLRSRLERGPLAPDEAVEVAVGIAEALVVVHEAGMVHRDLKPGNILLADSSVPGGRPVVKLADFGIAHLLGSERITTIGTVIGTAGYLSPEQIFGGEPGPSADIYALGLLVLEALTGVREYPGTAVEAVAARAARDPRIPASLPEDWRGLIGAMTARDPALRPSAMEVAVMVRELAPQLDGWAVAPGDYAATEDVPTQAMAAPAAAAASAADADPTRVLPSRRAARTTAGSRRRRGLLATGAVGGSVLAVVAALTLGSLMAPASQEPQSVPTTPRPTPSVLAPATTVAPAVAPTTQEPQPQQQTTNQQPVQQQPAPAQQGGPANGHGNGPGKNSGNGNGNGKGKP